MLKNLISGLVLSTVAFSAQSAFAETKCSPDFVVEYEGGKGTSIKVIAIEYFLDGAKQPHREDVRNVILTKGKSERFKSQTLGSVAKGQKIDARAIFHKDTGGGFGNAELRGDMRNSGKVCENNVTFNLVVN